MHHHLPPHPFSSERLHPRNQAPYTKGARYGGKCSTHLQSTERHEYRIHHCRGVACPGHRIGISDVFGGSGERFDVARVEASEG